MAQLTKNGIQQITEKKSNILVQFIDPKTHEQKDKDGFKGKVSDGFASLKVYFAKDSIDKIDASVKNGNFPIIKLDTDYVYRTVQNKIAQLIITNCTVIVGNIKQVIGSPIDYLEYQQGGFVNTNGSNEIPSEYLSQIPQGILPSTIPNQQQINNFNQNQNQNQVQPIPQQQNVQNNQINQQQNHQNNFNPLQQQKPNPQFQPQQQVQQIPQNLQQNQQQQLFQQNPQQIQQQNPQQIQQQNPQQIQQQNFQQYQQQPPHKVQPPSQKAFQSQLLQKQTAKPLNNLLSTAQSFGRQSGPIGQIPQQQQQVNLSSAYTPILGLNPSLGQNFKIKARVTSKKDVKEFNTKGKAGKLFSFDLIDQQGAEITATCFGESVDKFYDTIVEGQVYTFENGLIKNNQSTNFNKPNAYVINFNNQSIIDLADDDGSIQHDNFSFKTIEEFIQLDVKKRADLCVLIKNQGELQSLKGGALMKRTLTLTDQSLKGIEYTLFGDSANDTETYSQGKLIVLKDAAVSEFQGCKQVSYPRKVINENDQIPQFQKLRQFLKSAEGNLKIDQQVPQKLGSNKPISTIAQINEDAKDLEQNHGQSQYHNIFAHVTFIKPEGTLYYISCPDCRKKVIMNSDEIYSCQSCNKQVNPKARYVIPSLKIQDCSGALYASCFDEAGEILFGQPADEIRQIKEDPNHEEARLKLELEKYIQKPFLMTIQSKVESYEGQSRTKHIIQSIKEEINNVAEGRKILSQIQEYE